jgi:hypothetical protein
MVEWFHYLSDFMQMLAIAFAVLTVVDLAAAYFFYRRHQKNRVVQSPKSQSVEVKAGAPLKSKPSDLIIAYALMQGVVLFWIVFAVLKMNGS